MANLNIDKLLLHVSILLLIIVKGLKQKRKVAIIKTNIAQIIEAIEGGVIHTIIVKTDLDINSLLVSFTKKASLQRCLFSKHNCQDESS
jgi:hypothetical protein